MNDELTIALREELLHSGRKGMHWGVRLYQNKDGSLTPLGRVHYRKERKKQIKQELKDAAKAEKRELKEAKKKKNTVQSLANMSDDELRAAIARKQLEAQYMSYMPKKEKSRGRKFAEKFIDEAVIPGLTSAGKDAIERALKDVTTAQLDKAKKKREKSNKKKTTAQILEEQENQLKLYVSREQYKMMKAGQMPIPVYTTGGKQQKKKNKSDDNDED